MPEVVRVYLRRLIDQQPGEMPEELLDGVLAGWVHLFGLVSFEVFGRMEATIDAGREYFEDQMGLMADLAGLPA
ncbi:TetR-like C-terminal domain-containing protein [Kitasatospora sp. NPDC048538]|uniref:TetR-like C-terminal domain-containing protein n=1 Tax=unclassified Kitasatospora TaxID=2633591 RepID=UPI003410C706